jgi:hypothetical protein
VSDLFLKLGEQSAVNTDSEVAVIDVDGGWECLRAIP